MRNISTGIKKGEQIKGTVNFRLFETLASRGCKLPLMPKNLN